MDTINLSTIATTSVVGAYRSQLKFTELTNTEINGRITNLLNVNRTIYAVVKGNKFYHDKLHKSLC